MSRTRPLCTPWSIARAVGSAVVVVAAAGCSSAGNPTDRPFVADAPREAPLDQPAVAAADVPDMFAPAIGTVFERPSGAVDHHSWVYAADVKVDLFLELRWDGGRGTLRRWLRAEGGGLDTPEGRKVVAAFDDWEREETLEADALRREHADAEASMNLLLGTVALIDEGDGWWRGLGLNGFVAVGVHIVDGVVDHLEYGVSGTTGDIWSVVD